MKTARQETPLTAVIEDVIRSSGRTGISADGNELSAIPFHQYMTLCLYHPEFGYYRTGNSRIGREGDFYTSAFIGDVMGVQLASRLSRLAFELFPLDDTIQIVDWGGGTGRLSRQMMDAWYSPNEGAASVDRCGRTFTATIIEGNPEHRKAAERELEPFIRSGKARVIDEREAESLFHSEHPIFVVANELLDAFPVHRIVNKSGKVMEWGVAWEESKRLPVPCLMKEVNPALEEWMDEQGIKLLDGQTIEVNLDGASWASGLAGRLQRSLLILIDYGDEAEELTAPHRMDGTLLCYREHRAHNDPYRDPGEQDLTAHVNFSHIRRSVEGNGGKEIWYGTQKRFLLEAGILEQLSAHSHEDPFHPVVRRNRAIRQLLLSDGMSELFKVQIFVIE
ncbi:class I SAM-dependent methyltransferase [Cohnella terricola]|uniref:SAM-dependent methyltransferase n=1 Tax=Cohnella terricola TaxID=1289167 RepID=A0A559JL16_9BACL|nr:SAM-dependent methyltransferase [Cohnella terricola]TVY00565.1 SAM-dependent methyltransferase [Cohnella terricola]